MIASGDEFHTLVLDVKENLLGSGLSKISTDNLEKLFHYFDLEYPKIYAGDSLLRTNDRVSRFPSSTAAMEQILYFRNEHDDSSSWTRSTLLFFVALVFLRLLLFSVLVFHFSSMYIGLLCFDKHSQTTTTTTTFFCCCCCFSSPSSSSLLFSSLDGRHGRLRFIFVSHVNRAAFLSNEPTESTIKSERDDRCAWCRRLLLLRAALYDFYHVFLLLCLFIRERSIYDFHPHHHTACVYMMCVFIYE